MPAFMQFLIAQFHLPKFGNEKNEYEDAFAPKLSGRYERNSLSLAIADGASESSFAAEWAKMLTRAYAKEPFFNISHLQSQMETLAGRWKSVALRRPLPWFAEEKVRMGAFSTLLGIHLSEDSTDETQKGKWSVIAVGDSCLFQVRGDVLIESFPISKSLDFGTSPTLLSSNDSKNKSVWDKVAFKADRWQAGDMFFLITDALAFWFLSQHEHNERPWEILAGFVEDNNPIESFTTWVNNARASSMLKNDDVTLMFVKL